MWKAIRTGAGMRLGGLSHHAFHSGPRSFALHTGHTLAAAHTLANAHALHTAAPEMGASRTRIATRGLRTPGRALPSRAFAANFAHNRWWREGRNFHRMFGMGWVGPVFWPYAYNDVYCDVFSGWGYGCGDFYGYGYGPFWDYGYGDILSGLFSPYGYDDLSGYLASNLDNGLAYQAGGQSGGVRTRHGRYATAAAPPPGQALPQFRAGQRVSGDVAQLCGKDTREVAGLPNDRIQQILMPNDEQRTLLDDLANASVRAAQIIKSACPTSVALTPTGRLAAMQQRIEAMAQAVDVVRGPLDRFYGLLTDEQKAQLNAANQTQNARGRGSLVQNCASTNAVTQWPAAEIERVVRPNEAQLATLNALQNAAAQAAQQLAASCPSEMPVTPPARLAAVAKRLDVMLQAVKNVRAALNDFYGVLNDEQKAQFNLISQPRAAQQG
jgi:hypothetical protein